MSNFASTPPSKSSPAPAGMFQRGLVPVDPVDIASLIIFDIRALRLSVDEGRELEGELRETLFKMLDGRAKGLSERSAADLGGTVLGIAIE
jgi:hypothetical protein